MKIQYPEVLPISSHRDVLVKSIREHECVIIEGETGSGKSTQIPKMMYEALKETHGENVAIACTQPRRIAAVSIAARIAEECEIEPGLGVGHKIRFDDLTNDQTKIIICTDGILLQEIKFDSLLTRYHAVFVDEAHERSLRIDFLLGILKNIQRERKENGMEPLKIVIASATLDTAKFVKFFEQDRYITPGNPGNSGKNPKKQVPVFVVSGRMFPVEVFYTPPVYTDELYELIAKKVEDIHLSQRQGDILVFLPGQNEIMLTMQAIEHKGLRGLKCLPLFSKLSMEEQTSIFAPHPGKRHVIVSTNIAETSVTIPGITTVIDTGLARMTDFDYSTGIGSLTVQKISQSSAIQREGRAGRVEPGVCYRLYSREDFERREFHTPPEIQRSDLADVVLQMILMELPNIEHFDFVDPPEFEAFQQAFQTLRTLGAIDKKRQITDLGMKMAYLPLDTRISRMLLAARRYNCVEEVAVIASFLSVKNPFLRPVGEEEEADNALKYFQRLGMGREDFESGKQRPKNNRERRTKPYASDLLTYLSAWKKVFVIEDETARKQYCDSHYLNALAFEEAKLIYEQLIETLVEFGGQEFAMYLENHGSMLKNENLLRPLSDQKREGIIKSIASGQIQNLCQRNRFGNYSSQKADRITIHPGSMFFNRQPLLIIATEIMETTKIFARNITEINPDWLPEIAPHFHFEKRHQPNPRRNTFFTKHNRRGGYRGRRSYRRGRNH